MEDILKDPTMVRAIMEEIHRKRVEDAKTWYDVQVQLLKEIIENFKNHIHNEIENMLKDYKENQMIDLMTQFDNLESTNKRDLEAYIAANPQRQPLYEQISQMAKAYKGKKKVQTAKQITPVVTFENEIDSLLDELRGNDIPIDNLTLFADSAFLYHGKIYKQEQIVKLKSKNKVPLRAKLHDITEFEVTFEFDDRGLLPVKTSDITDGNVEIIDDEILSQA